MIKRQLLIITFAILLMACSPKIIVIPAPTLTFTPFGADTATPKVTATLPSTKTPTPTLTPTNTPVPSATPTNSFLDSYPIEGFGPINFPLNINPLTGMLVEDSTRLERRPISVKIAQYPRGTRPPWGISLADHVFEYYHEGGLTRFNAIFYGNDAEQIGPIRSARFTDKDIVEMYKAFFAYASADWRIRDRLAYSNFTDRMATISSSPCPPTAQYPLCRVEQSTWNHLVGNTEKLYEHFETKGVENNQQNLDGLSFNPVFPPGGQEANSVLVRYAYGSYHFWQFDSATKKYYRQQDVTDADQGEEQFEPMIDRLNGQPVSADNVVVLLAEHKYYSLIPEILEIPLDGFGKAYLFRDGYVYLINWIRVTNSDILILANDNGARIPLKPGNTWFVILGKNSLVQQSSPDWRFQFFTP